MRIPLRTFLVTLALFSGGGALLLGQEARPPEPQEFSEVRQLQRDAVREPFVEKTVKIKGVVTWVDENDGRQFYLQDATGGIKITFENGPWPVLEDNLVVTGVLSRGQFAPILRFARFVSSGHGKLPLRHIASAGGLLNGAYSGELILTDGWVRTAKLVNPTTIVAVLDSGASRLTIRLSDLQGLKPEGMIAAKATVTGVADPVRALRDSRQLVDVQVLMARRDFLTLVPTQTDPWKGPILPLDGVVQYHPGQTRGDRLRVAGQVIYQKDDVIYLSDGKSGIAIKEASHTDLKPGAWVEAIGFPDLEGFLPVLSDAEIRRRSPPPDRSIAPQMLPTSEQINASRHASYVTVSGKLVDLMRTTVHYSGAETGQTAKPQLVLALQSPRGVFTAELEGKTDTSHLPGFEIGSILRITGVCIVQTDAQGNPLGFKILIPNRRDIAIEKPAPFFNPQRLLIVLASLLAVLFFVALLAFIFARRNVTLRAENQERRAIAAERNRMARDLHDTLEQGLTGIQLQLQSIDLRPDGPATESVSRIEVVKSLVKQCHVELRQSVWNLRSAAMDEFDLGQALERAARMLVAGSNIAISLSQKREGGKIPSLVEDNLLRIGQEALTNAIKHACPSHLWIEVSSDSQKVTLTIRDDGQGMTDVESLSGHYGLVGMHERASRIGATLEITSRPASGSTIRVVVPVAPNPSQRSSS